MKLTLDLTPAVDGTYVLTVESTDCTVWTVTLPSGSLRAVLLKHMARELIDAVFYEGGPTWT